MKIPNSREQKVSVLVANFNNSIYLNRCIKSIQNQNYKNIEIIVVDDNSTDNSIEILKKIKKITIIKNEKKNYIGSYDQINVYKIAFLKAKGDIIFFLDSDDFFKRSKINTLVKFLNKTQDQLFFDLPIFYFSKNNFIIKKFSQKKFILSPWPRFSPQSCICIKRDLLTDVFKIISIKKFPDIWMDFRIAIYAYIRFKKINIVKKYLTIYQQSQYQVSAKYKFFSKKWWERRLQAYQYFYYIINKLKKKKLYSVDFFITVLINKLLKKF
jgi:glycosyltransferase involved in cell wall biosynthesis